MPRVSIGLTVFNSERSLDESIQSLLAQTFQDFELIVSDNASTDRTRQIALSYAAQDDRVKYMRNRMNIGVAGNFNQAFRLSSGEFFKWAAYDDLCAQDFLLRCIEVLDRDPDVVLAYPRTVGIDEHGRTTFPHAPGPDLTSPRPRRPIRPHHARPVLGHVAVRGYPSRCHVAHWIDAEKCRRRSRSSR